MNDARHKLLIIRLSSIGDILLTTSFIRQTRLNFPHSKIDFIIKDEFAELLKFNRNINHLIKYDSKTGFRGLIELKSSLIKNNYDLIFDLHNNFRSIYLRTGHSKAENHRIKKNKLTQFLYVKFKYNKYPQTIPIPERYLNVGKAAGIEDDDKGLEIFWDDKTNESVTQILDNHGISTNESFYTIAPGAGFYTKIWPIEYYKDLVKYIFKTHNTKIIVLGNTNDQDEGKELGNISEVIDLTGKMSLLQAAVVLSKSKAFISNDSGLMHMATAVNTPVLAIFGSTVKEFGFSPYRSKAIVVENKNLNCRPCSHIGRNNCPKEHFKCMIEISPEIVIENFEQLIIN
ncbi:MAG: glycosyltransferase family 9 protein [Calditrichia bacterium]|nr:glycosyltransferase family 9 protein [Calditrichia bacterium]